MKFLQFIASKSIEICVNWDSELTPCDLAELPASTTSFANYHIYFGWPNNFSNVHSKGLRHPPLYNEGSKLGNKSQDSEDHNQLDRDRLPCSSNISFVLSIDINEGQ